MPLKNVTVLIKAKGLRNCLCNVIIKYKNN